MSSMSTTSLDGSAVAGQARQGHLERLTYTSAEAAALLGVSRDVLQDNRADYGGFAVGRAIRFPRARIDALVAAPAVPDLPSAEQMAAALDDSRISGLLEAARVVCREVALLLAVQRREARDPASRAEWAESKMAVEDVLADLNALAAGRA